VFNSRVSAFIDRLHKFAFNLAEECFGQAQEKNFSFMAFSGITVF